jgi:two-component system LytT family sensor kinase
MIMNYNKHVAFNVAFWLLYFLYEWLGLAALYGDYSGYFINACLALPVSLTFSLLAVHYLFHRYYERGQVIRFWLGIILCSGSLLVLRRYFNYNFIYPHYFPFALKMPFWAAGKFLVDIINLYVITCLYALYYTVGYWYKEKDRVQELLRQQTLAELDLLKSQVQPHFVFNTLNNIYSTALKASPETADLIAHLSGFLNYNLYDASKDKIALTEELDYIGHYLKLQKNRFGERVEISEYITGNLQGIQLAPLLLLPLVENAFKHGVSCSLVASWVRIDVSHKNGMLIIAIENSCEDMPVRGNSFTGGIGLINVRRRLQLIYRGQHELQNIAKVNSYLVVLKIQIDGHDSLLNS